MALSIRPYKHKLLPCRNVNLNDCNSAAVSSVSEILSVDQVSDCDTRKVLVSYDTRIALALGNSLQLSVLCMKFL